MALRELKIEGSDKYKNSISCFYDGLSIDFKKKKE
jgi:hypothetical protein